MLATFYHIGIPVIIVWTVISAYNASYVLPIVYNELLLLPYRYSWDNKSVLSSFFSHEYNRMAILIQNVI